MAAAYISVLLFLSLLCQGYGHKDLPTLIKEVSQASNTFGVNLYRTETYISAGKRSNIFFSPLSIFTALATVKAGARGDTAFQLEQALSWHLIGHPGDDIKPNVKMQKFLDAALKTSAANPVKFANKLWLQNYFCTSACKFYAKSLIKHFQTDLGNVDFISSPEKARQLVNKWVESKTNGKVKDLLEPGTVSSLTRLVITNAIYFQSNWKYRFDKSLSYRDNFYVSDEKTVQADFMAMKTKVMLSQDADNMAIELPYSAPNLSMIVILPKSRLGISSLERKFSDNLLRKYLNSMKREKVHVYLPKFTLESELQLKDFLSLMGVRDVFDPANADLSGITGYKGLYVSHAIHKAYVEVNEEGTEAAAATGIGASFRSIETDVYDFNADHPFMFTIIHRPTVTMLFNGEVVDPTVQKTSSRLK